MISVRRSLRMTAASLAGMLFAHAAFADQPVSAKEDSFNTVMATYASISWRKPIEPSYANLGNDLFLLDTVQGLLLWDEPSNTFSQPEFPTVVDATKWQFDEKDISWTRLGDYPADTLVSVSRDDKSDSLPYFVISLASRAGLHTGDMSNTLLWWNGKKRHFAAALNFKSVFAPHLLQLGPHHALLCTSYKGGRVVRLRQSAGLSSLLWEEAGNIEARAALWSIGVVGKVEGFEELTEADITRPVYYDTSHCGWEITNPPDITIKPFLDRKTRKYAPDIKPYFLSDGRTLLSEVSYFNGKYWENMNPPLLWQPKTKSWAAIEHTSGGGGEIHRAGQEEPVMSYADHSEVIEFLDTKNMSWVRARQRLPRRGRDQHFGVKIEPLSNGQALVFLSVNGYGKQQVGLISPMLEELPVASGAESREPNVPSALMRDYLPVGQLALPRDGNHGVIALRDGGLMLVGNNDEWHPSVRSEIVDAGLGQSRQVASLPIPMASPHGLALKDNSILLFGGRCPANKQCSGLPAQLSYRYLPQENRWQPLPNLTIPFARGYSWLWPRNDALVRNNGDVVWIEGGEVTNSADEKMPQTTLLKRWRTENQNAKSETVASLRKGRYQSTLIELADGRLAVIGGYAQIGKVSVQNNCSDCPNETKFDGAYVPARSTELLDESNAAVWNAGPKAHYGGGRALKLANGRIFKLSLVGDFDEDGYRAEIADAAFTHWERLPPLPFQETVIRNIGVAGNLVIILTSTDHTVAWDDDAKAWLDWKGWPQGVGSKDDPPRSISALVDGKRVLVRYGSSFAVVDLP